MSWVRLDDGFPEHPKVLALGADYEVGISLLVRGMCYCARNLTDGFIPARTFSDNPQLVERLVELGLWERVEGGFQIHDYLAYNPSKERVLSTREAGRRRAANFRSNARCNGVTDGVTDGANNTTPQPLPVPDEEIDHPTPAGGDLMERLRAISCGALDSAKAQDLIDTYGRDVCWFEALKIADEVAGGLRVKSWAGLLEHRLRERGGPRHTPPSAPPCPSNCVNGWIPQEAADGSLTSRPCPECNAATAERLRKRCES